MWEGFCHLICHWRLRRICLDYRFFPSSRRVRKRKGGGRGATSSFLTFTRELSCRVSLPQSSHSRTLPNNYYSLSKRFIEILVQEYVFLVGLGASGWVSEFNPLHRLSCVKTKIHMVTNNINVSAYSSILVVPMLTFLGLKLIFWLIQSSWPLFCPTPFFHLTCLPFRLIATTFTIPFPIFSSMNKSKGWFIFVD